MSDALTPQRQRRLVAAIERPLRVRREILNLAAFASGHRKEPRGDECSTCKLRWPCPDVWRAAGPALGAFADCAGPDIWAGHDHRYDEPCGASNCPASSGPSTGAATEDGSK